MYFAHDVSDCEILFGYSLQHFTTVQFFSVAICRLPRRWSFVLVDGFTADVSVIIFVIISQIVVLFFSLPLFRAVVMCCSWAVAF